jgi:hypothetical protein
MPADIGLSADETERIHARARLMIEISARGRRFPAGLLKAAGRLIPEEAAVLADLESHGLNVMQLRDLLRGAHVLVDEPQLYERWVFPRVSRQRMSSHHRRSTSMSPPRRGSAKTTSSGSSSN